MTLLCEGQEIRHAYVVERFLGEGAFAEVYRVKHRFLGRQAMKVFKAEGLSAHEIEQMLSEAIILSRIGHPNIVRVFDADVAETAHGSFGYFTMEYVAGGSLDDFWRSHGGQFVPVTTAVEIMRQVCRGLAVAHSDSPPVIHRDIKPHNILIGYDPDGIRARVSDFGLAKHVNPLTLMASARGTRCFKAPEAFRDPKSDSSAGDVWALGSTLYLLLTDRLPYSALGDMDKFDSSSFDRPMIPASRLNILVDASLDQIISCALDLDAAKRYASAGEMLKDLDLWRPREISATMKLGSSPDASKSAMGPGGTSFDEQQAQTMARDAIAMSRQLGKLSVAADLMEEAFNKWPNLRKQYEYQLQLWRKGIAM
jgi:eukaryotic-like serine/threonine-protein kinase